jgi:hypothetical protein
MSVDRPAGTSLEPGLRFRALPQLRVTILGRAVPTWAVLAIAYLLSRVLTTGLLFVFWASGQHWTIAHYDGGSGFGGFLQSWDGLYYRRVALDGYPTTIPTDASGTVEKNAWAFLPVYPMIVRAVMAVTGFGFPVAGVLVAMAFGAAATFAIHRLLLERFGATIGIWGALFFCFGPMSYVLQVTYAESTYLYFMFAALAAMIARRYAAMIPFGILAAFSHPGALALAAALALQRFVGFLKRQPTSHRDRVLAVVTVSVIALAGIAWPFVSGIVTGDSGTYFNTEFAWWRDYIGSVHFLPFTPWFVFAGHYLGFLGIVIVVALLAGFVIWFTRRSTRALGTDLRAYTLSYIGYLVAVFLPQQSLFRMLLPLSPLLGAPVLSRTVRARVITLSSCIALQPVGILLFWVIWPP